MNTTNEMFEQIINVIVNSVADKVTAKMEQNISDIIDKKLAAYNFIEAIADNIDIDDIASQVKDCIDVDDLVEDAVDSAISRHDFSDDVKDALAGMTLKVTVSWLERSYNITMNRFEKIDWLKESCSQEFIHSQLLSELVGWMGEKEFNEFYDHLCRNWEIKTEEELNELINN